MPYHLARNTIEGDCHEMDYSSKGKDLFSALVFLGLPAACFVFGRWFAAREKRGWATYSIVTGVVFLGAFILSSAGFAQAEGLVIWPGCSSASQSSSASAGYPGSLSTCGEPPPKCGEGGGFRGEAARSRNGIPPVR